MNEFEELREAIEGDMNAEPDVAPVEEGEIDLFQRGKEFATFSKQDIANDLFDNFSGTVYKDIDWTPNGELFKGYMAGHAEMLAQIFAKHAESMSDDYED